MPRVPEGDGGRTAASAGATVRPAGAGADDGGRPPRDATTDRRWYGSDQLRVSAVSSTTKDVCSELSSTPLNEMVAVVPASEETSKVFCT